MNYNNSLANIILDNCMALDSQLQEELFALFKILHAALISINSAKVEARVHEIFKSSNLVKRPQRNPTFAWYGDLTYLELETFVMVSPWTPYNPSLHHIRDTTIWFLLFKLLVKFIFANDSNKPTLCPDR